MSVQRGLWGIGPNGSDNGSGRGQLRASLAREMAYLFTSVSNAGGGRNLSPSGVVHSLGVCLIEDWHMARGAKKESADKGGAGLPRFVDVKLDAEGRRDFLDWLPTSENPVTYLQRFADMSYRVGVAWSGEHQSYTVSLTCRDPESPNNGMCMTSFGKSLPQVVALAWYKHDCVCAGVWSEYDTPSTESFG